MKEYQAEALINASPDAIWTILTDGAAWPAFDPYCDKIEGTIAKGNKIKAFSKLSPGRAFPVTVSTFEAPREMVWSGGMPFGLFKGIRRFSLTEKGEGQTLFQLKETFSGPMLALIGKSIPDMTEPFEAFVQGLKERAES